MAAIFDLPATLTSESIHITSIVLLDFENGVTFQKFGDITFESRHPINILSD